MLCYSQEHLKVHFRERIVEIFYSANLTINFSRPLASTTFFRGQILSKFSVLAEFIEHLPAATELGVMSNMKLISSIIIMFFSIISMESYACMFPAPGYQFSVEELVDKSNSIIMVELERKEYIEDGIIYYLKPVEQIRGNNKEELIKYFGSLNKPHETTTYFYHYNPLFWFKDTGRSKWSCCMCSPDHTFESGHRYLFFPEYLGTKKSAEIIKNSNDLWYKYVKDRVDAR